MSDPIRRPHGWRLLATELRPRRGTLARCLAWSLLEALPSLLSGLVIARALDQGFFRHRDAAGLGWLGVLAAAMLVRAVAARASFGAMTATVEPLRDALVRRVVAGTLYEATVDDAGGDLTAVARLTRQVESVRTLLSGLLRTVRVFVAALVGAVTGLALLVPAIALIVVPLLALAAAVFAAMLRRLSRRRKAVVLAEETVAADIGRLFGGVRDIAAAGAHQHAYATIDRAITAQVTAARAVARASCLRLAVVSVGAHLPLLATLFAAPLLLRHGWASVGDVVGAATYLAVGFPSALGAMTSLSGSWGTELGVVLDRLDQAGPPPAAAPVHPRTPSPVTVDLRGVTFAYGTAAAPIVEDLSLRLPDSGQVTVVGPSGIGKSTVTRIIAGLRRPDRGEVHIGGVPVADLGPSARQLIALIPQQAYVFSGTVRENLAYLRPDAGDPDLDRACAAVGAAGLIDRLGGYDASIDDPDRLSAGERQLIALARAYASAARIVILDEATSHLDATTEQRVERAFVRRGGLLLVVAHRISSARRADMIMLMDGDQVHTGTHAELLMTSDLYRDLVGYDRPVATVPADSGPVAVAV